MRMTAVNAAGNKVFIGGIGHSFLSYSATDSPRVQVRYQAETAPLARDAVFVTESGKELLYVAGGTVIDVWDVTSITAPVHVGQYDASSEGTGSEFYGLRVDPVAHRAVAASTGGHIVIVDTRMIAAPATPYTSY